MKNNVKRNFILGDDWIYFKIFMGTKTSDDVLKNIINPINSYLYEKKLIIRWFFIRYPEPEPHIRLRYRTSSNEDVLVIINIFNRHFAELITQDIIWNLQTDTYKRELERYGGKTIDLSEQLFCIDSELVIRFLSLIEGDEGERIRWLFALRLIDNLLDSFKLELEEKVQLLNVLKISFGREFGMNKFLQKQLSQKFRKDRSSIEEFLGEAKDSTPYRPIDLLFVRHKEEMETIAQQIKSINKAKELEVDFFSLLGSFIHMSLNRTFRSKNRLNEMVCYDLLFQFYRSKMARKNN